MLGLESGGRDGKWGEAGGRGGKRKGREGKGRGKVEMEILCV